MKRTSVRTVLLRSSLALALAFGLGWLPNVQAADQVKGAQKLTELKPIKTIQDLEVLDQGDAVVMSCPKCKTMTLAYVETTKGHIKEDKVKQEHLCPGCQTKIETRGVGKAARQEVLHVCQKCGSKDVMCCVLKKGGAQRKGMEEKP
jgi:predicted RNA-binding Zn-ribbon protein involved in translation (DUF1610 family)